jgi:hypothetical protein
MSELPRRAGPVSMADASPLLVTPVAAMDVPSDKPETPLPADEINRLWQHGMHQERLFHDRLNYFSAIQVGLLGVFAILYHKEPSLAVFAPLTAVALAFALLWLRVQVRHWRYCVHVNERIKRAVPEYARTVAASPPRAGQTGCRSPDRWRWPCPSFSRLPGWRCSPGYSPGPEDDVRSNRWRRA